MLLIVIYSFRKLPYKKSSIHSFIPIGLLFGMVGNATSHLPAIALLTFLLGHLFFTAGLITKWKWTTKRFIITFPLIVYGLIIGYVLLQLPHNQSHSSIVILFLYTIALFIMSYATIMSGNIWAMMSSSLWMIASSISAWNLFIAPIQLVEPLIVLIYYAAQFSMAHSLSMFENNKMIIW